MPTDTVVAQDPEQLKVLGPDDVRLRGSRCPSCGRTYFPRRWECAVDLLRCEDVDLSTEGTLHVSTHVRTPSYGTAQLETEGYGVGQVDLPEGVRIQAVLQGEPEQWIWDSPFHLTTEALGTNADGQTVLTYRFAPGPAGPTTQLPHVGNLAARAAQRWPDRIAAVLGDRHLTFAELSRWVDVVAADLRSRGVGTGDSVLVHLPNSYEVLLFQLAAWRIGAIAVPVVPIYRRRELAFIVAAVTPKAVVTGAALPGRTPHDEFDQVLGATAGATMRYLVGGQAEGWLPVPPLPGGDEPAPSLPDPGGVDDCCLNLFTSGTTADPKGVRLSSQALMTATKAWVDIGTQQDDVTLAIAPLAHIAGMIPGGLLPLTVGCRVVILPQWDPQRAIDLIDEHGVTLSCGAAVFLQDLVDRYATAAPEIHRLSHFVSGGAATPPDLIRRAEAVGMRASRAFGMTETAGVIAIASAAADLERRANFDGPIVDGVEVRVVDELGNDLGRGVEGALRIRGAQILMSYTDPQVSREQLRDGWFDPGDLGVVTEDGWLRITGRTKDIINRGGEKFSARDIEEAILRHPAVSRVAVTALPDPRFGEQVGAFVTLEEGTEWAGPQVLVDHLLEIGMAKVKIPASWTVLDQLPVTLSGKVQKHVLRQLWEERA